LEVFNPLNHSINIDLEVEPNEWVGFVVGLNNTVNKITILIPFSEDGNFGKSVVRLRGLAPLTANGDYEF